MSAPEWNGWSFAEALKVSRVLAPKVTFHTQKKTKTKKPKKNQLVMVEWKLFLELSPLNFSCPTKLVTTRWLRMYGTKKGRFDYPPARFEVLYRLLYKRCCMKPNRSLISRGIYKVIFFSRSFFRVKRSWISRTTTASVSSVRNAHRPRRPHGIASQFTIGNVDAPPERTTIKKSWFA